MYSTDLFLQAGYGLWPSNTMYDWNVEYIETCSGLSSLLLETLSSSCIVYFLFLYSLVLCPQAAKTSLAQITTHTIFLESLSFISLTSYHILCLNVSFFHLPHLLVLLHYYEYLCKDHLKYTSPGILPYMCEHLKLIHHT